MSSAGSSMPPVVDSLDKIYDMNKLITQGKRYAALHKAFEAKFGVPPEFISRGPGRVNIIGEHIDYMGFSVMPMAIDRDVLIAVATTNDGKIEVDNVTEKYHSNSFSPHAAPEYVDIDPKAHEWSNFFKCGFKGVLQTIRPASTRGMRCLVDGSVPIGAGLSSSSAFVVSAALASLKANDAVPSKTDLAGMAIRGEQFAGVNIGGMDQTASVMGIPNHLLHISFLPSLSATPVPLPLVEPPLTFVVANSLVTSDKHATAPIHYNLRVAETRSAARILAKVMNLRDWNSVVTLRDVLERKYGNISEEDAGPERWETMLNELAVDVETHLTQEDGYSREDMAKALGISISEWEKTYATASPIRADIFFLRQRALHVYAEARRVVSFRRIAAALTAEAPASPENTAKKAFRALGNLMNESQESCAALFDCSCPELQELTDLALSSGAYGSRLTGAGWGGCTVSLVPLPEVDAFKAKLRAGYYEKRCGSLTDEQFNDYVFDSKPACGAAVYMV